jgi:hypothetical protein
MFGRLSSRELSVASALAASFAPPTAKIPHSPEDVGFADRFAWFVAYLPAIERVLVRFFLLAVWALPALLWFKLSSFPGLSESDRHLFVDKMFDSYGLLGRVVAKVSLLLTLPVFYADDDLRTAMGDLTHKRVAEKSFTFPVERGAEVVSETPILEVDVVVVGSGAGGAPVASELAQRGRSVVVLEEGGYRPSSTFPSKAFEALTELYRDAGVVASVGRPVVIIPVGKLVGGSTVINSGTCFRIPEFIHKRWRAAFDMPDELGAEALAPIYERVEEVVSSKEVTPDIFGANNNIARRGSEALGWRGGFLSRNDRGCVGSNRCAFGCPTDAKQAMHLTYLPQAVAAGARVISGARVEKVTFKGKVATGVIASVMDDQGRRKKLVVKARKVVVAAGTFYTPLLLRASGVRHRNLGRRLTLHPAVKISGLFPGENFLEGPSVPQSYYIDEFQEDGIMMEGAHVPPDLASIALPGKPDEHKALMERSHELAMFGFLVSDEPSGVVHRGFSGRPFLRYNLCKLDHDRVISGLKKLCRLFVAAGAKTLYLPTWKLPILEADEDMEARIDAANIKPIDLEVAAFHPLGTCGFGPSEETFPLDCDLKVRGKEGLYVADGSVFPTSLAVNPQLSIMAMATRCAWHLDEQLGSEQ